MTTYARRVGLFEGTMMVVGGIIGSGIFLNPSVVAQRAGTAGLTIAAWIIGGGVAILGAFIYAELGGRRPEAGGGYVYLRDAWGPLPAFLYAWTLLLVIATGAIAAVAMTFASYAAAVAGLPPAAITPIALASIVLLTFLNVLGVKPSSVTTSLFTLLKLAALGFLIVAGLAAILGRSALPAPVLLPLVHGAVPASLAGALVPVLFAYGGWQQTNFVAEELVDAPRNLPRALLWGVGIVVVVYLLANFVYLRVLGVGGLADSTAPAADTMQVLFGPAGRTFIAVGITLSTVGFLNLAICANARVYQAMARDRIFFDAFARLHPRFRTPVVALVAQGMWAVVLVLSGTYGELLDYVVFGDWIFFGLTAATVFFFRRQDARAGAAEPEFVTPAWRLSTLLFVVAAIYVVAGSVTASPANALRGAVLILLGVPLYLWRRGRRGPERGIGN
ncbi:MAG: putative permease [Gemmatimonadetes bacterium]|nr:putative permease [Gemmatimonadota bacterium]